MKNNILLLLLVVVVYRGEEIPHHVYDYILTSFILVGIDGCFWIYFPINSIKLVRSCILGAYLLCLSLILEVM